ncbi:MAG: hypothetical protein ABJA75_24100 [Bradyrhizobium sp.]
MRRALVIAIGIVALGALSGGAAYERARPQQILQKVEWREIAWPFPRDGWPAGKAFRSGDIEVYVRPKIGFCNCDVGVADDDEVDRVADLDLISERFVPLEAGRVVRVADMQGRIRPYTLSMADGSRHTAVGIAVSHRCDLMVAVAKGRGDAEEVQRTALAFLATGKMTNWMIASMDGR